MQKKPVSKNQEDYLSAIFQLEAEKGVAETKDIAERLGIAPASVSENIRKLAQKKLIKHALYKGVVLLPKGKALAIDVVRRHRVSERFLNTALGIEWENVHEEAHRMEHGLSRAVGEKLYEVLGRPKTCPHGNPIPDAQGNIVEEPSRPLTVLEKQQTGRIVKITNEEPKLLRHLAVLGLMPDAVIVLEERAPLHGPVMVRAGSATYALGEDVAKSIWVSTV